MKEKKYAKTIQGGTDTKRTKERKKILRRKHPKEVISLRKTKLVSTLESYHVTGYILKINKSIW